MPLFKYWTGALVIAVSAFACEQRKEPAPAVTTAASAKPAVASAAPSAALPANKAQPPSKEFAQPANDKLGSLPEGVGVPLGQPAADATVFDAQGKAASLAALWKDGPIVLVFYRGGWCPFCNFQVRSIARAYPEFQKRGVTPVMISVDRASEAAKTRATYQIPFPVLSDPDLVAHKAFKVLQPIEAEKVAKMKERGMDLEASSGKTHHTVAVPAIFIIDKNGRVRWAHADRDHKTRPKTAQLLSVLDSAGFKPKP